MGKLEQTTNCVNLGSLSLQVAWLCNDLENFKKRLVALEKQVAENGIILAEEQLAALERKKALLRNSFRSRTAHLD